MSECNEIEPASPQRSNIVGVSKGRGRGKARGPPQPTASKGYAKPGPKSHATKQGSATLGFESLLQEQSSKLRKVAEEEMRHSKVGSISEPMDHICMSKEQAQEREENFQNALYLGGLDGANIHAALTVRNIKFVISMVCDKAAVKTFEGIRYWRSPAIEDSPEASKELELMLDEVHALIDAELRKGHSVLVHCVMGVSRSASIVTSYVMRKLNLDCDQALRLVRLSRSIANPNGGFYQMLKAFEKKVLVVETCLPPATNLASKGKEKRSPPALAKAHLIPNWKQRREELDSKLKAWKVPAESIVRSDSFTKLGREDFLIPDPTIASKEIDAGAEAQLKLVCFDFDNTLAATHLYNAMAKRSSASGKLIHAMLIQAFKEEFGSDSARVFGGKKRLHMLKTKLSELRSKGVQLWIITMGSSHLADHALGECGLRGFFEGVTDDNPKQLAVQAIMNRFEKRLLAKQALLVDDSMSNLNDIHAPTQDTLDQMVQIGSISSEYRQLVQAAHPLCKGDAFPLGEIVSGSTGYCQVMLVSPVGVTKEQLDRICEKAGSAPIPTPASAGSFIPLYLGYPGLPEHDGESLNLWQPSQLQAF